MVKIFLVFIKITQIVYVKVVPWSKTVKNMFVYTPPIPEIIWVKNVRAIVVCGFLMK